VRTDGRREDEIRPVTMVKDFIGAAEGSVLIELGRTRVICNASVEEKVPPFLKDKGRGWVTAEYSMLPRATKERTPRESTRGKVGGRTHEIQRLIGRSLRAVVDLKKLGERTVWIDCDVIEADGGTRTASITGAYAALRLAVGRAMAAGLIAEDPVIDYLAAISVGMVDGRPLLDLCYEEDSKAEVDMNIVMTGRGGFVEVQGTAESEPFPRNDLNLMIGLAEGGIAELIAAQKAVLA